MYIPALLRIFVEITSNAIDNIYRSAEDGIDMSKIKIDIKKYLDALNFNGYKLREEYIEDLILISKLCIFIKSDLNFNFID